MNRFAWLKPKTMVGRLLLYIILALALTQLALAYLLQERKNGLVRDVIERQALQQTVMLYNLVNAAKPDDADRLVKTFFSDLTCAEIAVGPPSAEAMNSGEQKFAAQLAEMLGGNLQMAPHVDIANLKRGMFPCLKGREGSSDRPSGHKHTNRDKTLRVTSYVPLADQRWLSLTSAVEFPNADSVNIGVLFFLASLAVAAVAFATAITQTRSLSLLASASERFGRGEVVSPLPEHGPSEVVAATKAFNTMQTKLGDYIKDRMKLLAAIGHDLRTPLTTLRLKAEFLKEKAKRESLIATIDEMTVITDATLAFTRAEATTEATVQSNLGQLIRDISKESRAGSENIKIGALTSETYPCRPVAMKRALRNLIENALRYGGEALVSFKQGDDGVTISIDDIGPGIPENQIDQAFEPFVRLETSRSTETGGIGMGLAIARSIVKSHGGEIRLTNRAHGGLRAEIHLPAI
jgi:signal transduction histidine kinase